MNEIKDLLEQFKTKRVLVIGDVMIDSYLMGEVNRISPEAPVPVLLLKEEENRLGGAANVALNIASLGGQVVLCSVIGADKNGLEFNRLLTAKDIDTQGVILSDERKTTIKSRVFASGQQLLRIDEEDQHPLSQDEETELLSRVEVLLKKDKVDVILFQDYNKGVLTEQVIKEVISLAQKANIKTVVDPKKENFYAYQGVTLFKPNLKEISEALGRTIGTTKPELDSSIAELQARLVCENVLVTLSEKGMYAKSTKDSFIIPTTTQSVADVSGAGDTVISVVALGMATNANLRTIITLSNQAAGIVCSKLGVIPINAGELI